MSGLVKRLGIPFENEVALPVSFRGQRLECGYRADFVCFGAIIVELKALDSLTDSHHAQVINYLKATGFQRGLLLNFGTERLGIKRIVLDYHPEHLRNLRTES